MSAARASVPHGLRNSKGGFLRRSLHGVGIVTILLVSLVVVLHGQLPSGASSILKRPAAASGSGAGSTEVEQVRLLVGRSALVNVGFLITRVSLTTPDIADALVTSPQQLLVHGKAPGTISMFVWDRSGMTTRFEVVVERDLSTLVGQMTQLFPGEPITVSSNGKDIVLAGVVSSKYVVEKAAEVGAGFVDKKENVVNLLRQEEGQASNQVLLRVRFAEVSRSALSELGASLFTGPAGFKDYLGRSTTQQFPAPTFDQDQSGRQKLVFSDFLNLFLLNTNPEHSLGAVIKALQNRGLFQSLAEPNLIAENGKEASFLAGGEYPYPAVQGGANNLAITILFKEFGIRLSFTPTILRDDVVHLKVRPEVSALDFTNAVSFQGFRIPSLTTRRAETEVELRDGQTFAIAGLLNNTLTETMQKIPGIGDIPVLGLLFRSRAQQKSQSELVVMVTPQILKRNSVGAAPKLPDIQKPVLETPKNRLPPPAPHAPQEFKESSGATTSTSVPATTVSQAPSSRSLSSEPAVVPTIRNVPPPATTQASSPLSVPAQPAVAPVLPARPRVAATPAPTLVPPSDVFQLMSAPAPAVSRAAVVPSIPNLRPLSPTSTKDRKKAEERARETWKKQQERMKKQRETEAKRMAAEQKRGAELAKIARRWAEENRQEAEKRAREQARRGAEAAREQAERDAEAAKKAAEVARRQGELDKKRDKAVAEAQARLRAAQAAYEAELRRVAKELGVPAQTETSKVTNAPGQEQ
ncbi:MAG: pilus assembly protein N-terminal domain-containing protein [Acidobacteria bacterium]|nr:pilus assembly protein N-terminal domain-containing protein [Acidobacteriota bacterium]